ncbi:putative quinol monooxygenase [Colwelliaceae bacterium 6441]
MSIVRINEFTSAAGKSSELFEFLTSLSDHITQSEGCLSYEVLKAIDNENGFIVIEKWQSQDYHQQSIANFPKDDMQAAMSLFAAPPKGTYYHY